MWVNSKILLSINNDLGDFQQVKSVSKFQSIWQEKSEIFLSSLSQGYNKVHRAFLKFITKVFVKFTQATDSR